MNRRRRRIGRRRRHWSRVKREMQQWTATNYTELPKRGRLKVPAARLKYDLDRILRYGFEYLEKVMAPVMAFGRGSTSAPPTGPK